MIKVSVVGAKGRMGSHVVDAVNGAADTELALAFRCRRRSERNHSGEHRCGG